MPGNSRPAALCARSENCYGLDAASRRPCGVHANSNHMRAAFGMWGLLVHLPVHQRVLLPGAAPTGTCAWRGPRCNIIPAHSLKTATHAVRLHILHTGVADLTLQRISQLSHCHPAILQLLCHLSSSLPAGAGPQKCDQTRQPRTAAIMQSAPTTAPTHIACSLHHICRKTLV